MLTFKQWLVRQYGTTAPNITTKIVIKSANTKPVKVAGNNS